MTLRRYNKWTVLLLCIFLGRFGVHRFYVGKIGTGVLFMLITCICDKGSMLPLLLWAFDIIMILTDCFRSKNGLPLEDAGFRKTVQ